MGEFYGGRGASDLLDGDKVELGKVPDVNALLLVEGEHDVLVDGEPNHVLGGGIAQVGFRVIGDNTF